MQARYRAIRIWRALDSDRRRAAAEAFWSSDLVKEIDRAAAVEALASAMRFRAQTIRTSPPAKRAGYLAACTSIPDPVAGTVLYAYHMAHKLPLMTRFLDALEIPHEEGQIKEEIDPPCRESLEKALDALLAEHDRQDVITYLETLLCQDDVTWAELFPILEAQDTRPG
jgi:hypothetical protein